MSSESETEQEVLEKNDTSRQAKQKQVIAEIALAEQSEIEQLTVSESSKPSEQEKDELQLKQEQQKPLETAKSAESKEAEKPGAKATEVAQDTDPAEAEEAERRQAIAYARKGKMAYCDFSEDGKYLRDDNISKQEIDSRRKDATERADRVARMVDAMYDNKGMYSNEVFAQKRISLIAKENPEQAELIKTMDTLKDMVTVPDFANKREHQEAETRVYNVVTLYDVRKKELKANAKLERLDNMKEQLEHDKQLGLFKRIVKFNWLTKEGRANRLERARAEKELNEEVDSGRYAKYQKISLENKEIRDGMLGLSAGKDEERQDKMATLDKMVTLIDRTNTWNYDRKNQKDLDDPDYDYAIRYTYRPKISSDDGEQIFYSMMLEDWCQSREGQTRRELMSDKRRDQFVRNVVKNTDWRLA